MWHFAETNFRLTPIPFRQGSNKPIPSFFSRFNLIQHPILRVPFAFLLGLQLGLKLMVGNLLRNQRLISLERPFQEFEATAQGRGFPFVVSRIF